MLIDFTKKGREGEREGEKHQHQRGTLIGSHLYMLQPGIKPTTKTCAMTGNRTRDLSVTGQHSNQLSHTNQGQECYDLLIPSTN